MNWAIGIDTYTLICIKWITNKNLLYKKINKIKFQKQKIKEDSFVNKSSLSGTQCIFMQIDKIILLDFILSAWVIKNLIFPTA